MKEDKMGRRCTRPLPLLFQRAPKSRQALIVAGDEFPSAGHCHGKHNVTQIQLSYVRAIGHIDVIGTHHAAPRTNDDSILRWRQDDAGVKLKVDLPTARCIHH